MAKSSSLLLGGVGGWVATIQQTFWTDFIGHIIGALFWATFFKLAFWKFMKFIEIHPVCFNWDRLIGTISKFGVMYVVCPSVGMYVCVYVGH